MLEIRQMVDLTIAVGQKMAGYTENEPFTDGDPSNPYKISGV